MVVLVGALVAGVVLLTVAGITFIETVDGFARAPVGCTTTIEVDDPGTYGLFVESAGTVPDVGGDCPAGGEFEFTGDVPDVAIRIVGPDGAEVAVRPVRGRAYDIGASRGEQVATVRFPAPGSYRLTATASTTGLAVAVGRDPYTAAGPWAVGAVGVGLIGLLFGVAILRGGRRRVRAGA